LRAVFRLSFKEYPPVNEMKIGIFPIGFITAKKPSESFIISPNNFYTSFCLFFYCITLLAENVTGVNSFLMDGSPCFFTEADVFNIMFISF